MFILVFIPYFACVVVRVEVRELIQRPRQGAVVFRWVTGMVHLRTTGMCTCMNENVHVDVFMHMDAYLCSTCYIDMCPIRRTFPMPTVVQPCCLRAPGLRDNVMAWSTEVPGYFPPCSFLQYGNEYISRRLCGGMEVIAICFVLYWRMRGQRLIRSPTTRMHGPPEHRGTIL